nr:disease resistance protein RUN1-like [Ziziphus jujuba var. spinosa]
MDSPDVRVVGIWGMGGIGNTTLAGAIAPIIVVDDVNISSQIEFLVGNHGKHCGNRAFVTLITGGDYACGNPFAIKVLGSVLYSRSKEEWESALDKLEAVPKKDIQSVLKISYGELDDKEQDIFLDIACFFKGYDANFLERILDGCGLFAIIGIQSLIDKTLITIINNKLRMHDLLQEMGREIGSAKVEGIFLNTSEMKEIILSPEIFSQMHNLSQLEELWNGVQDLGKLIEMDLSHSKHLTKIPDVAHAPNLETINLEYCISLLQLPPTLQYHCKLSSLNLRCCSKLEKLPELSRNLKRVSFGRMYRNKRSSLIDWISGQTRVFESSQR